MPTARATLSLADACAVIGDAGFGHRPPGVGLELEWFVVGADGSRITDIALVRDALAADGPLPSGSRVTFEPGGQLELSTPPSTDGPGAIDAASADALAARTRLADTGLGLVGVGVDAGGPRPLVLAEPRYTAMAEYFAAQGSAGAAMMRTTASLQVNVGFTGDVAAQWELAHDLAPVLAAMFANSPLVDGRPSGWQSTRLATWAALDPARTRPVPDAADPRRAWVDYALDAPVMLVHDGGECLVPERQLSLREWVTAGHPLGFPEVADVEYHLTTLFPPIRPRGWLELRVLDALPEPWWRVAAAVAVTALTDAEARRQLAPAVAGARDRWLDAAWHGVHDPDLAGKGAAVLHAVEPALARTGYDDTIRTAVHDFGSRFVAVGRSPADELLDAWTARGALAPAPDPVLVPAR